MAADRYVTGDGLFHTNTCKLRIAKDGAIIGCSGSTFLQSKFERWYDNGACGPTDLQGHMEALVLMPDGTIRCYDETGEWFVHEAPACIGSGSAVAYGAMDAGASPAQAVLIACNRDTKTGGGVDVLVRP